jgi:hypothetical protein
MIQASARNTVCATKGLSINTMHGPCTVPLRDSRCFMKLTFGLLCKQRKLIKLSHMLSTLLFHPYGPPSSPKLPLAILTQSLMMIICQFLSPLRPFIFFHCRWRVRPDLLWPGGRGCGRYCTTGTSSR